MASLQIHHFTKAKQAGQMLVALTAWDLTSAQLVDQAGADLILVGDSLAMTILGYTSTVPVSLEEMLHHCKAVRRGVSRAFLVADLPFMSYQVSPQQALSTAARFMKEAQVSGVKVEGGYPDMIKTVATLVERGIPVLAHIGLTPQSHAQLGGFRRQGTTPQAADQLYHQAQALEAAGAFAMVLEHMPAEVAGQISRDLQIPTFGIGAGPTCDGQILVTHDLLGLSERLPPFAQAYLNLREQIHAALIQFCDDVRGHRFPQA